MGRKQKISNAKFKIMYKRATSMKKLALSTNMTVVSVYNYCERLRLPPIEHEHKRERERERVAMFLFTEYRGHTTLKDLAKKYSSSVVTIKKKLMDAVDCRWDYHWYRTHGFEKPKHPKPTSLAEVKIYHEASQIDSQAISDLTGVSLLKVKIYLRR